jgi:hypothetical protein
MFVFINIFSKLCSSGETKQSSSWKFNCKYMCSTKPHSYHVRSVLNAIQIMISTIAFMVFRVGIFTVIKLAQHLICLYVNFRFINMIHIVYVLQNSC